VSAARSAVARKSDEIFMSSFHCILNIDILNRGPNDVLAIDLCKPGINPCFSADIFAQPMQAFFF
jgi:hypothetical protein